MLSLLDRLNLPADLKRLTSAQMEVLAADIRETIIHTVSRTGGHLASSLGVVELTLALHRVFDSPRDKILWDVGHQAYAHKLLTCRLDRFDTPRQRGGICGFPKREESPHDAFGTGHASTAISAALGMAAARDLAGGNERIVAVIGDGALTGGLSFEGLNQAGHLHKNLIVVLNDNAMSISHNVGALSSFLSRKLSSKTVVRFKRETENILRHFPRIGNDLVSLARRAEDSLKGFFTPGMLFEGFGFDYYGPLDGHRLDELIETLQNVSQMKGPILVHVVTQKGRGYQPAEDSPAAYHGVGPFKQGNGKVRVATPAAAPAAPAYTAVFGQTLMELAQQDRRVVAITAAMSEGTGLKAFAQAFPDRFFDVGIAEQHAVTFAAGLACQGLRPVVAVYSTFLQRAYDSVVSDVCLQHLPVTFALDRAGLVGADGATHHGAFDLSYLRHIPNLVLAVPRNERQLQRLMYAAVDHDGPFAYRYPRGNGTGVPLDDKVEPMPIGQGEKLRDGDDAVIFAVGPEVDAARQAAETLAADGWQVAVVDAVYVKPLDRELILAEARRTGRVITIEENAVQGGFGSAVLELLAAEGVAVASLCLGLPDDFVEHGSQQELRALCGLDAAGIEAQLRRFLKPSRSAKRRTRTPKTTST